MSDGLMENGSRVQLQLQQQQRLTAGGVESVSYALYLHRQELGRLRRNRRLMRVASTKLQLTNELIRLKRRQWQLEAPSYQQMSALNRERQYRNVLWRNMQHEQQKLKLQQQQSQPPLQHQRKQKL